MNVLFLSHAPHEAHIEFAHAVGAKVKILPLAGMRTVLGNHIYALVSLLQVFFMRVTEDVILVDGGLPLPTAIALKRRHKNIKLIYLDADLFLYSLHRGGGPIDATWEKLLGAIDGIISVSETNRKCIPDFLKVPIQICPPYPKEVRDNGRPKGNYGLYVGRLDPDKHVQRIIDFGLQCPYFEKFMVVGDGTMRTYVEKVAAKNSKLEYVGWQSDVESYYNACKFFIHIPDRDPHPTTTMEAALCGCFPIISKETGTNYLFDSLFIVNDPNNFTEMNEKIRYILEHEQQAHELLQQSIQKMPRKDTSLKQFKNSFNEILEHIS